MFRKQILNIFNPLRYCTRYYAFVSGSTEKHEPWRMQVFSQLVSNYGNKNFFRVLFRENPKFENSDFQIWKNFMRTLSLNGFEYHDCLTILRRYPDILGCPPEQLNNVLDKWRTIFPSDMLRFLIINNPQFFEVDPQCITKRGLFLLSYCLSKESFMTMLFLCPNIMYENWDEIIKKIEFLNDEMVVYRTEIFHCKALSKPIQHIKLRFSILEKCGLYIRPNPLMYKQTKKERLKLNNPKLKDITDKSDTSFAKKVAKISLEEYNMYSELFNKYENDESDSEESDSDEEQ